MDLVDQGSLADWWTAYSLDAQLEVLNETGRGLRHLVTQNPDLPWLNAWADEANRLLAKLLFMRGKLLDDTRDRELAYVYVAEITGHRPGNDAELCRALVPPSLSVIHPVSTDAELSPSPLGMPVSPGSQVVMDSSQAIESMASPEADARTVGGPSAGRPPQRRVWKYVLLLALVGLCLVSLCALSVVQRPFRNSRAPLAALRNALTVALVGSAKDTVTPASPSPAVDERSATPLVAVSVTTPTPTHSPQASPGATLRPPFRLKDS